MANIPQGSVTAAYQTGAHPAHVAPAMYEKHEAGHQVATHESPHQSYPPHFQPQYSPPTGGRHHHDLYPYASQPIPQNYSQSGSQRYFHPAPQQYITYPVPQQYSQPAPQQYTQPAVAQQYVQRAVAQQYSQPAPQHNAQPPHNGHSYYQAPAPVYMHARVYQAQSLHQTLPPPKPAAVAPPAPQTAGDGQNSAGEQLKKFVKAGQEMMKKHEASEQQQAAKEQQQARDEMAQAMCPHLNDYLVEEPTGLAWMCCCLWLLTGSPAPCTQVRCTNCDFILQS